MGRITNMLRLILLGKRLKKKCKTKSYIVYSEDTCRIDEEGGPYIVKIRNE